MIHITIPDFGDIDLQHIVSEYNGRLAVDGVLIEGGVPPGQLWVWLVIPTTRRPCTVATSRTLARSG